MIEVVEICETTDKRIQTNPFKEVQRTLRKHKHKIKKNLENNEKWKILQRNRNNVKGKSNSKR